MSIKRLAFLAVLVTYFLIVFGGYVASSESGMGCGPDWPLCNGELVPSLHGATLVEYMHRVIGAIVGVISVLLWFKIRRADSGIHLRHAAHWMMILLVLQVLLGAFVVVLDLPTIVITIHLLIAMAFLAVLIFIWRTADSPRQGSSIKVSPLRQWFITHVNLVLGLVLTTIAFGAYIKHQGYGLSCGWLDCRESWLPDSNDQVLQTIHRILAAATVIYICLFAYMIFAKSQIFGLRTRVLWASACTFVQAVAGIITIITDLDISWAVIHLAIATALFAIIFELRVFLWIRRP